MSENSEISPSMSSRSLGEIPEISAIHLGIDLVSAAKRNITFLKSVADSQWLHQTNITVEAIRRYRDLWMPLISDLTVSNSSLPMILPPFDVEWIWFCHCLNHTSYREYCERRFSKLVGRAVINDEENREYALMRCREIWKSRYPFESFENEASSDSNDSDNVVAEGSLSLSLSLNDDEVFKEVEKQRLLCSKFMEPYRCDMLYLIAARQRYKAFLFMLQSLGSECSSRLVPTSDISLMWLTHQSYPTVYMEDLKVLALEGDMQKVATISETVKEKEFEETKILWDKAFNQPYEKAGGEVPLTLEGVISIKSPILWEESDIDVNTKYRSLLPRFLLEACVFVRLKPRIKASQKDRNRDFLRLRMIRCHSELKLDEAISTFPFDTWKKAWHVYCEFGTKGVMLEYRRHGGGNCLKRSSRQDTVSFRWNDLLRADSLTLEKEVSQQVNVVASITPPVQAPYLLKCVPDRVTDDSGAMISDVFLKMNSYRPQEGRWLSRTVLDHAGRVCFVIRIRVGGGFWRRGGETPSAVKWEDRIIEIREGSWSYVAGSIGRAPEKVVGTATPKEPAEQCKAAWCFSTGDELIIQWDSSLLVSSLTFSLTNPTSLESSVKLLKGRQMQYQVKKTMPNNKNEEMKHGLEEDEEGFLTLVRFTEDNPDGKATALLNWRLLVVEVLPEEDAVLMLLLCISILKSVSEMKKHDVGGLLVRRRLKQANFGTKDWGSVILHPSSFGDSPYVQPWYWNAELVMTFDEVDQLKRQPVLSHSAVEGSDKLYKHGIITVTGKGFVAVNITFRNTAGSSKHQAVAVRNGADMSVFYNCSFEGYQDTLYAHSLRQFYKNCDIYGTVDFIFGNAAAIFQNCNIYPRLPMQNQFNAITAQGRTDPNQNTGFSIWNCYIVAASELGGANNNYNDIKTYLGRPWKEYSRTIYMQSFIDGLIDPKGWMEWLGDFALSTLYYAEYANWGQGSNTSNRVTWEGYHQIDGKDADEFTVNKFIQGDTWLPMTGVPFRAGFQ